MANESDLRKLSEEQKRSVLAWLNEGESMRMVIERIAKPEPEGFGIEASAATLCRLTPVWRQEELLGGRETQRRQTQALVLREEEALQYQRATVSVLQQRLFESALECRRQQEQRETLKLLLDYQVKMRRLDLAERKLEETKRQFEFNAARAALKHWHQLKEIHEAPGGDAEAKVWQTREKVFVQRKEADEKAGVNEGGVNRSAPSVAKVK